MAQALFFCPLPSPPTPPAKERAFGHRNVVDRDLTKSGDGSGLSWATS